MKVATRRGPRPGRERPFSPGYLVVFDWDEVGNKSRLAINTGGTVVHYYAYDAISQLTTLQSANKDNGVFDANAYEYNEVGQKRKQTHTNDSTSYFGYDDASRLADQKTLKSTDGSTLANLTYTRDASGRITQIDKPAGAAGYFQYDRASRVTVDHRWESGVAAQIDYYGYDAAGNRVRRHTFGGAAQNSYYSYDDGDRLTCVHDVVAPEHTYFDYDEGGRIIRQIGLAAADPQYYFYDQEARTTSIRSKTAEQESFAWDSTGMKRQQGTDDYVFDGANLLSVTNAGGTLDKASGYGPQIAPGVGGLDYQYEDGTGVPVHLEDQVGTGGLVLGSDEAEVTDYNFKSPDLSTFGEGEISAIADGSRVLSEKQFVNPAAGGGERAVGVYDFGARLYDPTLGIFLVPDPLVTGIGVGPLGGDGGSGNIYVRANAVNAVDVMGLQEFLSDDKLAFLFDYELEGLAKTYRMLEARLAVSDPVVSRRYGERALLLEKLVLVRRRNRQPYVEPEVPAGQLKPWDMRPEPTYPAGGTPVFWEESFKNFSNSPKEEFWIDQAMNLISYSIARCKCELSERQYDLLASAASAAREVYNRGALRFFSVTGENRSLVHGRTLSPLVSKIAREEGAIIGVNRLFGKVRGMVLGHVLDPCNLSSVILHEGTHLLGGIGTAEDYPNYIGGGGDMDPVTKQDLSSQHVLWRRCSGCDVSPYGQGFVENKWNWHIGKK